MARIGKLNKRIQIQSPSQTTNSLNEPLNTWETVATRWASVEPISSKEITVAQQINALTTHKVVLRSFDGLTHAHRFLHGSTVLEITSIVDDSDFQACFAIAKEGG